MPAPVHRTPVEDTVPKVNNEIAVGEDVEFQRRWWSFERGVWILFALIVALDLAGAFGRGPLAHARMRTADGAMDVKYERIERTGTPSVLSIQFSPAAIHDGKVQFWVSESMLEQLGNQRIAPQPAISTVGQGGVLYTFPATAGSASAVLALRPSAPGIFPFTLRVLGSPELHANIFVMP